jgi:hypothetical protein
MAVNIDPTQLTMLLDGIDFATGCDPAEVD